MSELIKELPVLEEEEAPILDINESIFTQLLNVSSEYAAWILTRRHYKKVPEVGRNSKICKICDQISPNNVRLYHDIECIVGKAERFLRFEEETFRRLEFITQDLEELRQIGIQFDIPQISTFVDRILKNFYRSMQ